MEHHCGFRRQSWELEISTASSHREHRNLLKLNNETWALCLPSKRQILRNIVACYPSTTLPLLPSSAVLFKHRSGYEYARAECVSLVRLTHWQLDWLNCTHLRALQMLKQVWYLTFLLGKIFQLLLFWLRSSEFCTLISTYLSKYLSGRTIWRKWRRLLQATCTDEVL